MAQALEVLPQPEPFTDDDALASLMTSGGRIDTSTSALARQWGWDRSRVRRRLTRWQAEGRLTRLTDGDGQTVILVSPPAEVIEAEVVEPVTNVAAKSYVPGRDPDRGGGHRVVAGVVALLALSIAACGLQVNAWYGASLGRTPDASALLSRLSVVVALVALAMPSAARLLAYSGRRFEALVAWSVWSVVMVPALLAAVGFAAVNIADTTAGRGKVAGQAADLTATVERLAGERAAIRETRAVSAIEAEISAAQGTAAAVWSRTAACTDITRPASADACAPVLRLRQALGEAKRREALDAELRQARADLAALPAVMTADPQAEAAAGLANWATRGILGVEQHDIEMVRVAGWTLAPNLAGLVLMVAFGLWRVRREA